MDINEALSKYEKNCLKEAKKAGKRERMRININPDSVIGREIMYQTALIHQILHETQTQTSVLMEIQKMISKGENPPVK